MTSIIATWQSLSKKSDGEEKKTKAEGNAELTALTETEKELPGKFILLLLACPLKPGRTLSINWLLLCPYRS